MAETPCLHRDTSPVGFTEAPVDQADPAVVGMVLRTEVHLCPDCLCLVVGATLRPTGGPRVAWVTTSLITLRPEHRGTTARVVSGDG